jgi:hypothetical protein
VSRLGLFGVIYRGMKRPLWIVMPAMVAGIHVLTAAHASKTSMELRQRSPHGTKRNAGRIERVIKAAADVSPIDAFGVKATREDRIRLRSQRLERLQFP